MTHIKEAILAPKCIMFVSFLFPINILFSWSPELQATHFYEQSCEKCDKYKHVCFMKHWKNTNL